MNRFVAPLITASLVGLFVVVRIALTESSTAGSWTSGSTPPPDVTAALDMALGPECTAADEATETIRLALDAAGRFDWHVTQDASAEATGCVSAVVVADEREIRLTVALRPEVRQALRRLTNLLLDDCLTRTEAIELVNETLGAVGETGYELRTDGPRTGPHERADDIAHHMAQGCYMYGGVGFKPDGGRVYLIGGTLE